MFVVVEIGCLECGCDSGVVAVFATRAEADTVAERCNKRLHWRQGGQNWFKVFELPPAGVVSEEYRVAMEGGDDD